MTSLPEQTLSPASIKPVKPRRTNVERSAATQAKVIASAIKCLNDLGYEGTTVILVAREAAVSRGAAQHQFPSKVDLMMAVADHVVAHQRQLRKEMWDALVADGSSLSNMVDLSWSLQSHPDNIALLEIMMATRNDKELHQRFEPFFDYMNQERMHGVAEIAKSMGAPVDHPEIVALVRVHYATMRGLAIEGIVSGDNAREAESGIRAAIEMVKKYEWNTLKRLYAKLQDEGKADSSTG